MLNEIPEIYAAREKKRIFKWNGEMIIKKENKILSVWLITDRFKMLINYFEIWIFTMDRVCLMLKLYAEDIYSSWLSFLQYNKTTII